MIKNNLLHTTVRYTALGILFGLSFPATATWLYLTLILHEPLTWTNILHYQQTQPLLWIIDTAPLFLGAFALLAGYRLAQWNALKAGLAQTIAERTAEAQAAYQHLSHEMAEHQRIQELIAHAKQEWEAIFDAVSNLILLVDSEGNIGRCNRAVTHALGQPFSVLIGKPAAEALLGTGAAR
jgi:PAS domain-containing protein